MHRLSMPQSIETPQLIKLRRYNKNCFALVSMCYLLPVPNTACIYQQAVKSVDHSPSRVASNLFGAPLAEETITTTSTTTAIAATTTAETGTSLPFAFGIFKKSDTQGGFQPVFYM